MPIYGFNENDKASLLGLIEGVGGESIGPSGRPIVSGRLEYFWPPTGGIPAATNSTTSLVCGSAMCYRATKNSDGNYSKGTSTEMVENEVSTVVGASGKAMGCIRNAYGRYTVIVEDCEATTSTGGGGFNHDPLGGGTTNGVDFSVSIGV